MIRIGVVDDHAIVRTALRQHFSEHVDLRVNGEAANAEDGVKLACSGEVDVLVMDLAMPGPNASDALAEIVRRAPQVRVLILSAYPEELYGVALMHVGASGYLNKLCELPDIVNAVRTVALGGRVVSDAVAAVLRDRAVRRKEGPLHEQLSAREMDVFVRLARGEKIGRIAEGMNISVKTASTYRARVLTKLGLGSNPELTRYAVSNRLID
ncbi:MAG: response regulator transcription factor [Pseudomonadota bacterium]